MKNQNTMLAELTEKFYEEGYRGEYLTKAVYRAAMVVAYFNGQIEIANYYKAKI